MNGTAVRAIWFAYMMLVSAGVGVSGGVLSFLGGARVANAVLTAGGAFAAAATLGLLILAFLSERKAP
ncbi:hypothetical protein [Actinoplanes sp. NPDC049316]|uniref:hypothetical protein n=1 Tax=Actinoplanes sp. NPDC049316 TaxID=3154727 RepID=UPI0034165902